MVGLHIRIVHLGIDLAVDHNTANLVTFTSSYIYFTEQPENIAVGRPAYQSSTYDVRPLGPEVAVDGNTATHLDSKSCTHTNTDTNPWWFVDLQWTRNVYRVDLTNRVDCCSM